VCKKKSQPQRPSARARHGCLLPRPPPPLPKPRRSCSRCAASVRVRTPRSSRGCSPGPNSASSSRCPTPQYDGVARNRCTYMLLLDAYARAGRLEDSWWVLGGGEAPRVQPRHRRVQHAGVVLPGLWHVEHGHPPHRGDAGA
jgi:hypothetical protein